MSPAKVMLPAAASDTVVSIRVEAAVRVTSPLKSKLAALLVAPRTVLSAVMSTAPRRVVAPRPPASTTPLPAFKVSSCAPSTLARSMVPPAALVSSERSPPRAISKAVTLPALTLPDRVEPAPVASTDRLFSVASSKLRVRCAITATSSA